MFESSKSIYNVNFTCSLILKDYRNKSDLKVLTWKCALYWKANKHEFNQINRALHPFQAFRMIRIQLTSIKKLRHWISYVLYLISRNCNKLLSFLFREMSLCLDGHFVISIESTLSKGYNWWKRLSNNRLRWMWHFLVRNSCQMISRSIPATLSF